MLLGRANLLRVELLGRFRVLVGGTVVPATDWPSRRSRELVQLLALSAGYRLTRDQVFEALWPQLSERSAAANLRKAAHYARQALGMPDAVTLRQGMVTLAASGGVETDAALFEASADAALESGDPLLAAQTASMYTGELLPESLYEDWTEPSRTRLRLRYARLLEQAGLWEQLVDFDPLDETAYRELISRAIASGNRPEAIRWYGRLRAALVQLGVEPSSETEAVYSECVASLTPRGEAALVGRGAELDRAAELLHRTGEAEPGALLVRGPAGIGKSALCRTFAATAQKEGWELICITVDDATAAHAYGPLTVVVERLLRRDPNRLEAISPNARAILAELTSLAKPAPPLEGPMLRHRVTAALRRLFEARGRVARVLLIVDDVHLCDRASLEAFFSLAGRSDDSVMVVLAYRNEPGFTKLSSSAAKLVQRGAVEMDLGPLTTADTAAVVSLEASSRLEPDVVANIVQAAEGNPFFARELARCAAADTAARIPSSLWEAIRTRFVGMDSASVDMLARLALAGDDLGTDEIVALTGLPEPELFALLDAALEHDVMTVAGGRYQFRHELVRRALAERLPPHRRIAVHRDTARRLIEAGGAPGRIARHWLQGERREDARVWLLNAARHAVRFGAFADALHSLDTLAEHVGGADSDTETLMLRAEVLDALGDSRALGTYAAATSRAEPERAREIRPRLALAQLKSGDPEGALRTLQGAAPVTTSGRICRALAMSGAAAVGFGDSDLAAKEAAAAWQLALEAGDAGAQVEASWAQSLAAHAGHQLKSRLRADLVATRDLPELAIRVFDGHLCATERLLYGAEPYPDVVAFAEALAATARSLGAIRGQAFARTLAGTARLLSGDLDEAERELVDGVRLHRSIGATAGEALAGERLAEVALHRGRRPEALGLLGQALAAARESYLGQHLLDRIYGARIAAAGDPEESFAIVQEAESAIQGPSETCPACRITLVVPAAIAAARVGDLERADRYAGAVQALATRIVPLPGWKAAVLEVNAELARARGDRARALDLFRRAAGAFHVAGQPLDGARCEARAKS